jgi:hypothetical protein
VSGLFVVSDTARSNKLFDTDARPRSSASLRFSLPVTGQLRR